MIPIVQFAYFLIIGDANHDGPGFAGNGAQFNTRPGIAFGFLINLGDAVHRRKLQEED